MSIDKIVICLAVSRKLSGRCIAGIEIVSPGKLNWIRPVSDREHEEVSETERQYEDGSDPQVLDIIKVPLLHPKPKAYQPENWLLDPKYYWSKLHRCPRDLLGALCGSSDSLWVNGYSTYFGLNDRLPLSVATTQNSSLTLCQVQNLTIKVFRPGEAFGNSKRRVQGRFTFGLSDYRLWVTDPRYERYYLGGPDGEYQIDDCYLTISLGEEHEGFCYKLIAAIIEPKGNPG